ncbi:MAG: tRNA (adenosine(37)-N6)-threonylcarbamoyltransferase complex dimerization subunit type 1 TsaB [Provencibacterium sp.]|nr:tRNA (adenosine(37)-N6)-threonylcarbamoyltransferase complex dimerization subunit type 1 TsaB [Provencibacterium sp.]
MKLLAIESSSRAASCALVTDGTLTGEYFLNCGLTHSQTLMPLIERLCHEAGPLQAVDRIAVSSGPGSFTGLRIGLASAKAIGSALGVPVAGVSTLLALCYNLLGFEGICCAALDARRAQIYGALFYLHDGKAQRLTADAALPLDEMAGQITAQAARLGNPQTPVFLVGDGAELCYSAFCRKGLSQARLAPAPLRLQRASSVAYAALEEGGWQAAGDLVPQYLRLSQAERELQEKQAASGFRTE